jgi:hypothetical protein
VVWPQNHSDGFHRFGLKTDGDTFCRFDLKTCCNGFLWFGLKTSGDDFSSLASKLVATISPVSVSWLSFKIKMVEGFLVWVSKLPRQFLGLGLKTK